MSIRERIEARRRRVEELKRARENLEKLSEDEPVAPLSPSTQRARTGSTKSTAHGDGRQRAASILSTSVSRISDDDRSHGGGDGATAAQMAALQAEVEALKSQVHQLHGEKSTLEVSNKAAQTANAELTAKVTEQKETVDSLQTRLTKALQAQHQGTDAAASVEALWQVKLEQAETQHQSQLETIGASYKQMLDEKSSLAQQLEQKTAEMNQLGQMLLGAASSAGIDPANFDLAGMLEEHKLSQEENEQLQAMLESSLADLDAARGKSQRHAESLAFVEETLASYEEENRSLLEELNQLKDTYKKSSGSLDEEVKELRVRSATLEEQVKGLAAEAEANKNEADSLRQQAQDETAAAQRLRQDKQALQAEVEELNTQATDYKDKWQGAKTELEALATDMQAKEEALTQQAQQASVLAQHAQEEMGKMQQIVAAEHEAVDSAKMEHEQEIDRAKAEHQRELVDLQEQLMRNEVHMQGVIDAIAVELRGAKDDANHQGSLSDMVEELRNAKQRSQEEAEAWQAKQVETQAKLDEREMLLTQVMEHVQGMTAATGGGETSDMSPLDALQHKLEQLSSEREALLQSIEQNELDIETLQQQLDTSEALVEQLKAEQARLSDALDSRERELEASNQKLSEREEMLSSVMAFLQGKKEEDEDGNPIPTTTDVLNSGTDFVKDFEAQLELAAAQRDELMAAVQQLSEALQATKAELATLERTSSDKIDELETEVARLAPYEDQTAKLKEQVADLTAQRQQLQDELADVKEKNETLSSDLAAKTAELAALREELAALDDNMRKAAHAGLSLSEMINQLKEQHAQREAELLAELKTLQAQLADYEARLQRLKDLFPDGDGEGGDIIEQLQHRLELALRQKSEMETLLEELQAELDQKITQLEALTAERDELSSKLSKTEALLEEVQQELSASELEVARLKELLGKAAKAMQLDGYDSGDETAEPDFSQEGLDALIAELEARLQHIIKLEGDIEELTAQIRQLQLQLEASTMANQELVDEVSSLQASKTQLEHELEVLQSKMLLQLENIKTLEMEVKSLKRIQKRNERTIQQQKATIDQLRKLLEAYQDTGINTVGGDYVNDPSLVKRFREMEQEINSLLSEIADLQAQLDKERDFFRKRFLKKWGQNTTDCNGCGLEFSVMLRRHHCRLCGGVFCSQCCNDRVQTSASRRPVRVCHDCNEFLLKIEEEDQEKARLQSEAVATYGEVHEVVIEKSVSSEPLGMEVVFDFEENEDGKELTAELIRVAPDGLASRSGVRTKDIIIRIGSAIVADMKSRAEATAAMSTNPLRLWIKSLSSNSPSATPTNKRWIEDIKRRVRSNTTLSGQSPIGSPQPHRRSPRPTLSPPSVYSTPLGAPMPSMNAATTQGRDSPSRLAQSTTVHAKKPPIKPMPRLSVSDEADETSNGPGMATPVEAKAPSAGPTTSKPANGKPPASNPATKTPEKTKTASAGPKRNGASKPKPGNPFDEPASPTKVKNKAINPFDEIKRGSKSAPASSVNLVNGHPNGSSPVLPSVPKAEPKVESASKPLAKAKRRPPSDLFDD
eukprot:m.251567 g.251567  ORF g.251567 m.251567 type:complete len:1550 (+) comp17522_c0_seq1:61-4710(+)